MSKDIIINLPVRKYHKIMTAFIYKYIHDVIDDVTRSQRRSNFEIDISQSIFELERRSKAQNVGNANGYLSSILNFRYHFRWESFSRAQNGGYLKKIEILNTTSNCPRYEKNVQILPKKVPS